MKKIIVWISFGVLLTAGAFFIPEQSGSMWPSVMAASVVAFLYVIAFSAIWLPKIQSSKKRKVIAACFTILLVFSAASALISYEDSVRQRENLSEIRSQIENDLVYGFIHKPLVETLGRFYRNNDAGENIGALFTSRYDSLIGQGGLFRYGNPDSDDQTLFLYVSEAKADSVVLIGESSYLEGRNSGFKNFSGNDGRFQVRGILTSKGVDYERQN